MNIPEYKYSGARSMVQLHEIEMRRFLVVWRSAKATKGFTLPETDDSSYLSLDHLAEHVLGCARSYMNWMCEKLELPLPGIPPVPSVEEISAIAEDYLETILTGWREPLKDLPESRFEEVYLSRWNVPYCIDAMMEHAVLHPIRHRFQLEKLLK